MAQKSNQATENDDISIVDRITGKKMLTLFLILVPSLLIAMCTAIESQLVAISFQVVLIFYQLIIVRNLLEQYYGD